MPMPKGAKCGKCQKLKERIEDLENELEDCREKFDDLMKWVEKEGYDYDDVVEEAGLL